MRKSILNFIGLASLFWGQVVYGAPFRLVTYDEIRREGGFGAQTLRNVIEIIPAGSKLVEEEKTALLESTSLVNLLSLNLSNQAIDDKFIEVLCQKPTFSRLENLDLSGTSVTMATVYSILDSAVVGSLRERPQVHGGLGRTYTRICIKAPNSKIIPPSPSDKVFEKKNLEFTIEYQDPVSGKINNGPHTGVKIIEVLLV